ncbi:sulfate permease [Apiospora saccharicola]
MPRDANQRRHVPDRGELRVSRQEPAQRDGHCWLHSLDHLRTLAGPFLATQGHAFCHHCELPGPYLSRLRLASVSPWSIVYTLLRSAFVKPLVQLDSDGETRGDFAPSSNSNSNEYSDNGVVNLSYNFAPAAASTLRIPSDTIVICFTDALFFPNAQRGKGTALEAVQLVSMGFVLCRLHQVCCSRLPTFAHSMYLS